MASKIKLNNNQGDTITLEHSDTISSLGSRVIPLDNITHKVSTIAELRAMTERPEFVYVEAYDDSGSTYGAFGSHLFKRSLVVAADNGGTVINSVNDTYELQYSGAVNVKWFNNDIQNAVNCLNDNGILTLNDEEYIVDSSIALPSNLTIVGNNSIIKTDSTSLSFYVFVLAGKSNIKITGIEFVDINLTLVDNTTNCFGVHIEACSNIVIEGCKAYNLSCFVYASNTNNLTAEKNIIESSWWGIFLTGGTSTHTTDCLISNNYCRNNMGTPLGAEYGCRRIIFSNNICINNGDEGIACDALSNEDNYSEYIYITDNIIQGTTEESIKISGSVKSAFIHSNICDSSVYAPNFGKVYIDGNRATEITRTYDSGLDFYPQASVITNNRCQLIAVIASQGDINILNNTVIASGVATGESEYVGIRAEGVDASSSIKINISSNSISNINGTNVSTDYYYGITTQYAKEANITNNILQEVKRGIKAQASILTSVTNNVINNITTSTSPSIILSNYGKCICSDNKCYEISRSYIGSGTDYPMYTKIQGNTCNGIYITGLKENCDILNNVIDCSIIVDVNYGIRAEGASNYEDITIKMSNNSISNLSNSGAGYPEHAVLLAKANIAITEGTTITNCVNGFMLSDGLYYHRNYGTTIHNYTDGISLSSAYTNVGTSTFVGTNFTYINTGDCLIHYN